MSKNARFSPEIMFYNDFTKTKGAQLNMERHIAIIDPDPVFARSMSQRLLHLIPSTQISLYSPEDLKGDASLILTEDVILYDETRTDQEILRRHTGTSNTPCLIPMQSQGTKDRRKMTGSELSRKVFEAGSGSNTMKFGTSLPDENFSSAAIEFTKAFVPKQPVEESYYRPKGHLRILLSFADRSDRERYTASCTKSLLASGLRIIRLDLMSGISMVNPFRRKSGFMEVRDLPSSGISELLLQLENVKMEPRDLLSFVQLGQDGCYHFGLPVRSDDILCCQPDVLVRLLHLLRRLADMPDENTAVLVVVESLPFCVLKQLCSLSHELHIIMPQQDQSDQKMCEWELTDLFACLPPNLLKFFSESKKAGI